MTFNRLKPHFASYCGFSLSSSVQENETRLNSFVESRHISSKYFDYEIGLYLARMRVFLNPEISIYFPLRNTEAKQTKTDIV